MYLISSRTPFTDPNVLFQNQVIEENLKRILRHEGNHSFYPTNSVLYRQCFIFRNPYFNSNSIIERGIMSSIFLYSYFPIMFFFRSSSSFGLIRNPNPDPDPAGIFPWIRPRWGSIHIKLK